MRYKLLGCDPGTNNFAYTVIEYDVDPKFRFQVIETGMLPVTVKNLVGSDFKTSCALFKRQIKKIIKTHGIESICAERFMSRRLGGSTIEAVSVMLGILHDLVKEEVEVITAAQWKNAFNKLHSLEDVYEDALCEVHQVDSSLIAVYAACKFNEIPYFQSLNRSQFLNQLKRANVSPLPNKKAKRK